MSRSFDFESLKKIHSDLTERKGRLDREMTGREREQGELERIDTQAEMVDVAQSLELIERNMSLQEQERRELASIDRALEKISSGEYGSCEDCGEEIPFKRLLAVPEARFCTRCQSLAERERARSRAG
ncbi:MAG: TraR/DksA family transcriptional regulator [Oligoflexia bacterium]